MIFYSTYTKEKIIVLAMKRHIITILALFCSILTAYSQNSQVIQVDGEWFFSIGLCNENGERLTLAELDALSDSGFDMDYFNKLRRRFITCEVIMAVSDVALLYAGCYRIFGGHQEDERGVWQNKVADSIETTSMVVAAASAILGIVWWRKMNKQVELFNQKAIIQPSENGLGLCLSF